MELFVICSDHTTSGVATGVKGGRVSPLDSKKFTKNREKEEKIRKKQEKEGKIEKKRKNQEGSFTLPLLTDRTGYTTAYNL